MKNILSLITPEIWLLVLLFVMKVLDNLFGTAKQIFIQRNKVFLAPLCLILSDLIYFSITKKIVSSDGYASLIFVSVASGVGCALAMIVNNRLSKDRTYAHVIMSDDFEGMKRLGDFLSEKHIIHVASNCYTKDWSAQTISITAYAETKQQSKWIDEYIKESDIKVKRVITNEKK